MTLDEATSKEEVEAALEAGDDEPERVVGLAPVLGVEADDLVVASDSAAYIPHRFTRVMFS